VLVEGRRDVARKLGGVASPPVQVYLASSDPQFHSLTGGRIPHWGVGVAFPASGTIVLKVQRGQTDELLRTARHELSHTLLHNAVSSGSSARRVPVWFDEGVAMWAAGEWRFRYSAEVAFAAVGGGLLPLDDIDAVLAFESPKAQLAYTQSYLAVLFLLETAGQDAVAAVVEEMVAGAQFDVALYRITGMTPDRFEDGWRIYIHSRFGLQGILLSPEAIWVYLVFVLVAVATGIRFRNRATLRRWEEEDPLAALPLRLRLQVKRRGRHE